LVASCCQLRGCQLRQRHIPHRSRGRPPEARTHPRESPHAAHKGLLTTGITAYPRSSLKHEDRPVTPEVAAHRCTGRMTPKNSETDRGDALSFSPLETGTRRSSIPTITASSAVSAETCRSTRGRATARILREAAFFAPVGADLRLEAELEHERPLQLGPFTITPYLVDHSAFDAYAVVIEAESRRLFYSGDLRSHGRKQRAVERLLRSPPTDVHVLLLEGTNVGRSASPHTVPSEDAVEHAARRVFSDTDGLALCLFSPQNVDRLVSLFRAAKDAAEDECRPRREHAVHLTRVRAHSAKVPTLTRP
jgi:hypothetical protein